MLKTSCPLPLLAAFTLALCGALSYTGGLDVLTLYFAAAGLLLWCGALLYPQAGTERFIPKFSLISGVMALLLAWLFISLPFSAIPSVSYELAFSFGALPMAYFLARWTEARYGAGRDLLTLLHLAGAGIALFAIVEFLFTRTRTMSIFLDFNALAAFLNLCAFSAYGQLLADWKTRDSRYPPVGGLVLLAILILGMTTTQSLGGLLSFAPAWVVLALVQDWRNARTRILTGLLPLLLLAAYAFIVTYRADTSGPLDKLAVANTHLSGTNRVMMWQSAWHMFLDHPAIGIGLGMYKTYYSQYRDPGDVTSSGDLAHSDYVQTLAEGGPLLFGCIVALLGIVLWKLFKLARAPRNGSRSPEVELQAGLWVALLVVQLHAAINFIYYVMPLAFSMGLVLARADLAPPQVSTQRPRLWFWSALLLIAGVLVTGSLGARGVFAELAWGDCSYRGCRTLRADKGFMQNFAGYLAATQPSWVVARDYLSNRYLGAVKAVDKEEDKIKWRLRALQENVGVIHDTPRVGYAYHRVATLLNEHPELGFMLPEGMSPNAEFYYRKNLEFDPQNMQARIELAELLAREGKKQEGFDLLFVDGMRWWNSSAVTQGERQLLLAHTLPMALDLGRCKDAREMADGLIVFDPKNTAVQRVIDGVTPEAASVVGCGLPPEAPAATPIPPSAKAG